jgi:hypothetical protein
MIVERITWLAKVGHKMEVVELLKDLQQQSDVTERLYSSMIGANDETIVVELEFETMEDRRKSWEHWGAQPEFRDATQRMREMIESGGVHQIWRLH